MSRQSRFSKLEGERESNDDEQKPATGASLERFGAEPEMSPRADPVDAMAPEHGAERLQRFEADGSDGLGLDRDPLALLPMLQCPACGIACGKFETACHGCQTSLTSDSARAHNLKRLEALQTEKAAALEADREQREKDLLEGELRAMGTRAAEHGMALELRDAYGEKKQSGVLQRAAVVAVSLLLALFAHGWVRGLSSVVLIVTVLTFLPRAVWLKLGEKARIRDRY